MMITIAPIPTKISGCRIRKVYSKKICRCGDRSGIYILKSNYPGGRLVGDAASPCHVRTFCTGAESVQERLLVFLAAGHVEINLVIIDTKRGKILCHLLN